MTKRIEGAVRGGDRPFDPPRPRNCRQCEEVFPARYGKHFYCSDKCHGKKKRAAYWTPMEKFGHSSFMGNTCELFVQYTLSRAGWHVYNSVGAYAPFDIVVFRDGMLRTVEIRKGKISTTGRRVQFNRGHTEKRPVFKSGTQWVAIVILDMPEVFVFEITKPTNFFDVSKRIDIRTANHPEKGDGE